MSKDSRVVRHTLSVIVDNEPGVLARVVGLFSGRGYNIESLSVAEVDQQSHTSRITLVTSGTPEVIDQIQAQLSRLVPVQRVLDLTMEKPGVERELALVKIAGSPEQRAEAARLAQVYRANVIDTTATSFIFEVAGERSKIDTFVDAMRPLGLLEVSRTGVAAITKGAEAI